jgi:hypothetical protein
MSDPNNEAQRPDGAPAVEGLPEGWMDIYKLAVEMADRVSGRRTTIGFLPVQRLFAALVAGTLAQQRRCFSARRASLPCAQHWQVSLSLLSQPRTSRKVSLSSGAAARRRVRRSPRRALPLSGPPGPPAPHQPAVADQSCYRQPLRLGSASASYWPQTRQ